MELCLGLKELVSASLATIRTNFVAIGVFTGKGTFGSAFAKNLIRKRI
jgi:hypothetical protein